LDQLQCEMVLYTVTTRFRNPRQNCFRWEPEYAGIMVSRVGISRAIFLPTSGGWRKDEVPFPG